MRSNQPTSKPLQLVFTKHFNIIIFLKNLNYNCLISMPNKA